MISLLRRYRKSLFFACITIFLIGTFVGLGGYLFTKNDMSEAVASVGSAKIPYSRFIQRVNRYSDMLRSRGTDVNDEMVKEIKRQMLQDMIIDELLIKKADELGITVTDEELSRDIQSNPEFRRSDQFQQELYFYAVRQAGDTPESYEESRRRQLRVGKLKGVIWNSAKLTPAEIDEIYGRERERFLKELKGSKTKASDFPPKEEFARRVHEQRALELVNYYLRQLAPQAQIMSYLEQRESGGA
ncbi:MAG: SurA N-terminal domain-containing protein [Elusimicrobia bacterium]|nr:SurA N-terminal domain-containing protein [Elusimicrobiota bacterium]